MHETESPLPPEQAAETTTSATAGWIWLAAGWGLQVALYVALRLVFFNRIDDEPTAFQQVLMLGLGYAVLPVGALLSSLLACAGARRLAAAGARNAALVARWLQPALVFAFGYHGTLLGLFPLLMLAGGYLPPVLGLLRRSAPRA